MTPERSCIESPRHWDPNATPCSVYVHFPWCLIACPYCDFTTTLLGKRTIPHAQYATAVLRELSMRLPEAGLGGRGGSSVAGEGMSWEAARAGGATASRPLRSIFFGGGTPSLWDAEELARVIAGIRAAFAPSEVVSEQAVSEQAVSEQAGQTCVATPGSGALEVTVECNPAQHLRDKMRALRAAGVTRVSIGAQSLRDDELVFLGRDHHVGDVARSVEAAQAAGLFVNVDMLFGLPGQSVERWRAQLVELLRWGVHHVSAYALTIEARTKFASLRKKGALRVASDAHYVALFRTAEETLCRAGMHHHEVSNYAVPGHHSRHNHHDWHGGDCIGLGVSAVGKLGCLEGRDRLGRARRYRNERSVKRYLACLSREGDHLAAMAPGTVPVMAPGTVPAMATQEAPWVEGAGRIADASSHEAGASGVSWPWELESEWLGAHTAWLEAGMVGLRTAQGWDLPGTRMRLGVDPDRARVTRIDAAVREGDVLLRDGYLRVPSEDWPILDTILARTL